MRTHHDTCPQDTDGMLVRPLEKEDLFQAYALVRLYEPDMALGAWCLRVETDCCDGRSCWAKVSDCRGYIHAVFRFSPNRDAMFHHAAGVTELYVAEIARRPVLAAMKDWCDHSMIHAGNVRIHPSAWALLGADNGR